MPYVSLNGGTYQNRSLIASAQRCVNLYVEPTPQVAGEPMMYAHYPTPGTMTQRLAPVNVCRCLYTASTGDLYACYGQNVYYIDPNWQFNYLGTMVGSVLQDQVPLQTPISMTDNGLSLLISDGSVDGWTLTLAGRTGFARIDPSVNTGWLGSPRVDFLQTFLIASSPGTSVWYISDSSTTNFEPLQFAGKTGSPDPIVAVASTQLSVWILGTQSFEVWNTVGVQIGGTNLFPYSPVTTAYGNWGCASLRSIATSFDQIYWLTQDKSGKGMIYRGQGITPKKISTFAIDNEIASYPTISDAEGYTYNQEGHVFYVITFPSANNFKGKTWVYDGNTEQWHERVWIDANGEEWAWCVRFPTEAYGFVVGGDRFSNNFYTLDLNNYTDDGNPITRIRSMPHNIDLQSNHRIRYKRLVANMEVGSENSNDGIPSMTIINCSFTAPTGTLMPNYNNINDVGSTFTYAGGTTTAQILNDSMISVGSGVANYYLSGHPMIPDYVVTYDAVFTKNAVPDANADLYVIGREVGGLGYQALLTSNGTSLFAELNVMNTSNTSIAMGNVTSSSYQVALTMQDTAISMSVYRKADGTYLIPTGTWSPTPAYAIQIMDDTYTATGNVIAGGNWI